MSYLIPDDPIVRSMERTGFPPWLQEDSHELCPVCGQLCETIYTYQDGSVVGCENCLTAHDVYDYNS